MEDGGWRSRSDLHQASGGRGTDRVGWSRWLVARLGARRAVCQRKGVGCRGREPDCETRACVAGLVRKVRKVKRIAAGRVAKRATRRKGGQATAGASADQIQETPREKSRKLRTE